MVTIWLICGSGRSRFSRDQVDQPLLAEFSEIIFRLSDAVAVGEKNLAGMHLDRAFFVRHVVEKSDDRASDIEPADGAIFVQSESVGRCPPLL